MTQRIAAWLERYTREGRYGALLERMLRKLDPEGWARTDAYIAEIELEQEVSFIMYQELGAMVTENKGDPEKILELWKWSM